METNVTLIQTVNLTKLSRTLQAWKNCLQAIDRLKTDAKQDFIESRLEITRLSEWVDKHQDSINEILKALPHGSGIDSGVTFDQNKSTSEKLIFSVPFHSMNEHGYYDGWVDFTLIVTPCFGGYNIRITGRDKNQLKEYLSQLFYETFTV